MKGWRELLCLMLGHKNAGNVTNVQTLPEGTILQRRCERCGTFEWEDVRTIYGLKSKSKSQQK